MKKFDFYISYLCASKCVFCCVLDKITWFRDHGIPPHMSFADMKDILDAKRRDGFGYVTFTGGEPTLHPDFIKILAYAKKLGMRTSVNSNMAMLADMEFCRDALRYVDEIVASIHGHEPGLHNSTTGTKRGFEKFTQAMDNIHVIDSELYLITDTVLTTLNVDHVSEIVDMLVSFPKLRHVLFSNVNLPPDKLEGRDHLVPRLARIEETLPLISRRIDVEANKILRFYGVPFCILKEYHAYSSDLYFEPKMVIERVRKEDEMIDREYSAPKPVLAKKKTSKCRKCIYYKTCGGFFNSYYLLFGDDDVQPVTRS